MKSKRFVDLTFAEITEIVLEKESSLEDLKRKALILLRSSLAAVGRIQVVADSYLVPSPPLVFFENLRFSMERLAQVTRFLDDLELKNKKVPAATETQSTNNEEHHE